MFCEKCKKEIIATAREEYERTINPSWKGYIIKTEPIRKKYDKMIAKLNKRKEKLIAPYLEKYRMVETPAKKKYDAVWEKR